MRSTQTGPVAGIAEPSDGHERRTGAVVWFDELEGDVRAVVGGKSASLVEMRRAGFPVPPGFAITVAAFERFGEETGVTAQVERIVATTDPDSTESLRAASERIEALAAQVRLPAGLLGLVEGAYRRMAQETGEDDPAVAVRSSAVGEDSAEASFAGQQETYLWVRGLAELELAVRRCWASYFSPHALSYRARLAGGLGVGTVGMSVGVQQMVDADVAGVMFTRSPTTNDRSIVAIEAGLGLGVSVVAGEITPDQVWVNKVTRADREAPAWLQAGALRAQPGHRGDNVRGRAGGRGDAAVPRRRDSQAVSRVRCPARAPLRRGAGRRVGADPGRRRHAVDRAVAVTTDHHRTAQEPVATPLPSQTDYVVQQLLAASKKKIEL